MGFYKDAMGNESFPISTQHHTIIAMNAAGSVQNMSFGFRLKGPIQMDKIQKAIQSLYDDNESYRMKLYYEDGQAVLKVLEHYECPIQIHQPAGDTVEERLEQVAVEMGGRTLLPVDNTGGSCLESHIYLLGEDEYLVVFLGDHIVIDGYSTSLTLQQFFCNLMGYPLPDIKYRQNYCQYLVEEKAMRDKKENQQYFDYWKERFAGYEDFKFDTPTREEAEQPYDRNIVFQKKRLEAIAKNLRTSTANLFGMALYLSLAKTTGRTDCGFNMAAMNRSIEPYYMTIGYFVKTLFHRLELDESETVRDFIKRGHRQLSLDIQNTIYAPTIGAQVTLVVQNYGGSEMPKIEGIEITPWFPPYTTDVNDNLKSQPLLVFMCIETAAETVMQTLYNPYMYKANLINELATYIEAAIDYFENNPDGSVRAFLHPEVTDRP